MTETPQAPITGATEVPPQARGPERTAEPVPPYRGEAAVPEATGWVGWIFFAAMMMIMVGTFQVIMGLTSLFNSGYYLVGEDNLLVNVDFTAWGWTHIALGAIAVIAAFGLMAGQMWARVVAIVLALVSSIVNLAFIEAYPLWSLVVITLDVLVIYAIAAHGREVKGSSF